MVRGIRDRAVQAPGYGAFGSVQFNPATDRAIQQIREVGGVFALGTRFPFNDGSTDVVALNTGNLAGGKHTYDTFEINASQTITCTGSPVWIAARKVKLNAGAVLTADGVGGVGASGTMSGAAAAGGQAYANSQSYFGGAGGGAGGGNSTTGTVRAGGAGGKAFAGATAAAGGTGAASGTATDGQAGHAPRMGLGILDTYIVLLNDSIGGAGGGAGAPGEFGGVVAGGDGGDGGGLIIITCEVFENLGTIRARGTDGQAGGTSSDRSGGGGGGGGGGDIIVLCVQRLALGTFEVDPGQGGAGGAGATRIGGAGGAGYEGLTYIEQQYIA